LIVGNILSDRKPLTIQLQQIKYMENFQCIGADCPDTCCQQWDIYVTDAESARIKEKVLSKGEGLVSPDKGFGHDENGRRILLMDGEGTQCHFLQAKTCSLQTNFGHEILPKTCRTYPRSYARLGQIARLSGYTSCPEVARLLIEDGDQCNIESLRMTKSSIDEKEIVYTHSATHGWEHKILAFDGFLFGIFWERKKIDPFDGLMYMSYGANYIEKELSADHLNVRQISVELNKTLGSIDRQVLGLNVRDLDYKHIVSYLLTDIFQYLIKKFAYHTYYDFLYKTLNTYHEQVNSGSPFTVDSVSFTADGLFDAFTLNRNRIWSSHGDILQLCFANCIKHHLFKYTVIQHSSMILYTRRLLAILWIYTILIVGHPSLRESDQGSVTEEIVKKTLSECIYIASRFIEHTSIITDMEKLLDNYGFTNIYGLYGLIMGLMPNRSSMVDQSKGTL
jgi:Fe-S-cluster containining protein